MGMFDGLIGGLSNIVGAFENKRTARKASEEADKNERNYYSDLDFQREIAAMGKRDPTYQSSLIGPYQRSESPAARAYLESLLTGDNPQANNTPWGGGGQSNAGFDQRYGGYDALLEQGSRHRAKTPWETKTPGPVDTSAFDALKDANQTTSRGVVYEDQIDKGYSPGLRDQRGGR